MAMVVGLRIYLLFIFCYNKKSRYLCSHILHVRQQKWCVAVAHFTTITTNNIEIPFGSCMSLNTGPSKQDGRRQRPVTCSVPLVDMIGVNARDVLSSIARNPSDRMLNQAVNCVW